jgi:hypothetical protein
MIILLFRYGKTGRKQQVRPEFLWMLGVQTNLNFPLFNLNHSDGFCPWRSARKLPDHQSEALKKSRFPLPRRSSTNWLRLESGSPPTPQLRNPCTGQHSHARPSINSFSSSSCARWADLPPDSRLRRNVDEGQGDRQKKTLCHPLKEGTGLGDLEEKLIC